MNEERQQSPLAWIVIAMLAAQLVLLALICLQLADLNDYLVRIKGFVYSILVTRT